MLSFDNSGKDFAEKIIKNDMNNKILFVSNENNDTHLLDAYSSTITGVVSNVSSAVAHIQVEKG